MGHAAHAGKGVATAIGIRKGADDNANVSAAAQPDGQLGVVGDAVDVDDAAGGDPGQ